MNRRHATWIDHVAQPSYRAFSVLTLAKFYTKRQYAVAYMPGSFWGSPAPRSIALSTQLPEVLASAFRLRPGGGLVAGSARRCERSFVAHCDIALRLLPAHRLKSSCCPLRQIIPNRAQGFKHSGFEKLRRFRLRDVQKQMQVSLAFSP